ncbi:MAG: ubiquinol-cytochrome c reductase iron-sulfur subunit [Planctomycetaceae bacterium]|nr:ubiquinol-cytochrome c reductase iron-sulfur subunit [Planctomycetaceae bacterium]
MADKKKLTVAEMLAAARAADSGGSAEKPAADAPTPGASAAAEGAPAAPAKQASSPAAGEPVKPATAPGGGRLSVAEMLAAARKAPAATPPAAAKAAPTPKPKPAAAAKPAEPAAPAEPRDTASILGAARKGEKAGPMSKAEAAAKAPAPAPPKATIVVPPMPVKPDYAKPKVAAAAKAIDDTDRRDFVGIMLAVGFWMVGIIGTLWTLLTVKFMFPNVLREPPSKFKVGFPDAFPGGQVQEKFKAQFGIWVVNAEYNGQQQIVALKSVCTHLGCTPNWLEAEQKFKCPCHGSGFYKDGINFEGPAPRPLERYAIRLADDGQIEVDKSRTFQEEMGAWTDPASFIPV